MFKISLCEIYINLHSLKQVLFLSFMGITFLDSPKVRELNAKPRLALMKL